VFYIIQQLPVDTLGVLDAPDPKGLVEPLAAADSAGIEY
jgi:hypothetical protein